MCLSGTTESDDEKSGNDDSVDGSDSEGGSGSEDDDSNGGGAEAIDVAERPQHGQSRNNVTPKVMLDVQYEWRADEELKMGCILERVVDEGDFEAFVHIADLYQGFPKKIPFPLDILSRIVRNDEVEMLDQFIRWTGLGIKIQVPKKEGEGEEVFDHSDSKMYLGLSVHGKKRVDLARKHDPNATKEKSEDFPLLWQAAAKGKKGGKGIIEYLWGDRPLAAYRFYASSNSDSRARKLKETVDLEKVLPEWLGWTISSVGDSPLAAAIIGGKVEILKLLFKLSPQLMTTALNTRYVLCAPSCVF